MKVVIVVGFFDRVWSELERRYSAQIAAKTLVLVKPAYPSPVVRINDVSSFVADASTRATSVLVVTASLVGYEWVTARIVELVDACGARKSNVTMKTEVLGEAGSYEKVVQLIDTFGLPQPSGIATELVRKAVGDTKVLCVSSEGRTRMIDALSRAGFDIESLEDLFVERIIPGGKNSNLLAEITSEAHQCKHLLYAWDGLRTLAPAVKKKFSGKQFEAATASQVAEGFRRWVLSKSRNEPSS